MKFTPYLNFPGTCKEAFTFYAQVLGAKIEAMIPFAGTPAEAHSRPDFKDKIMHAKLSVGDQVLMASDAEPEHFKTAQGMSVSLHIEKAADAERIFAAFAEKGVTILPIQETFWALRFGMCVDRFGTPWMINCEKAH